MSEELVPGNYIEVLKDRTRVAASGSTVVSIYRRCLKTVTSSRLASLPRWLECATRDSFLYRWLTKEPEPDVIVIDLRETWTVGPVIATLDRLIDCLYPYWQTSTVKRGGDRLVQFGELLAETRTGQKIRRLLEPPEIE